MSIAEEIDAIEISNIGTIEYLRIPVPAEGGLVRVVAENGGGKTTALDSLAALLRGSGKLPVNDNATKGIVRGLGATINVSLTRSTSGGELLFSSCETDFDLSDLVNPKFKDREARERHRIKALVRMSEPVPNPEPLIALLGEDEFKAIVNPAALEAEDLVTMAERVKRDIDKAALEAEKKADREATEANTCRSMVGTVDLTAESDSAILHEAYTAAAVADQKLRSEAESARKILEQAAAARAAMEEAESDLQGPSVGEAAEAVRLARVEVDSCVKKVEELQEALSKARAELSLAAERRKTAESVHATAINQRKVLEVLQGQIDAAQGVTSPDVAQLFESRHKVTEAQKAVETGALIRQAKERIAQADAHAQAAALLRKKAEQYRNAAKRTDEVLSDVVATLGCPLSVHRGVLVTPTDRSDKEPYDDLSDGERWHLAVQIAINKSQELERKTGKRAILYLNQEAFQGLDHKRRRAINQQLKGSGVVLIGAECSQDESEDALRAEVIEP